MTQITIAPCDCAAAPLCFPPWCRAPVDRAPAGANADHHGRHRQLRHACSFDQYRYDYKGPDSVQKEVRQLWFWTTRRWRLVRLRIP
jgi:hypothetical protein